MKNQIMLNHRLTKLQIFFACTILLPFTMILGIVWLCQAYHRCFHEESATEDGRVRVTGSLDKSHRAAVAEHDSWLLPVNLSA